MLWILKRTISYVVDTQKNCLNETVLLSTQNTCLNRWIGKYSQFILNFFLLYLISVGKPIEVVKSENPTQEEIDDLHEKYVKGLVEVFEDNKTKFGLDESIHLNFIG